MPQPPSVDRFPVSPACWYLFGHLSELPAWSSVERPARFAARRPSKPKVEKSRSLTPVVHVGGRLGLRPGRRRDHPLPVPSLAVRRRWTLHAFAFANNHSGIRGSELTRRSYNTGWCSIFNGAEPLFPLPFFFEQDPAEFVPGRPFRFTGDCSWYMIAANGFDGQRFQAVHDRRLTRPPEVDCPRRVARRMRFHARGAR